MTHDPVAIPPELIAAQRAEIEDDLLRSELHMLAVLLQKHKHLVNIIPPGDPEMSMMEVNDYSSELHPMVEVRIG